MPPEHFLVNEYYSINPGILQLKVDVVPYQEGVDRPDLPPQIGVSSQVFLPDLIQHIHVEELLRRLSMKLFIIGRLSYCFYEAEYDLPEKTLRKGDKVIQIHIPRGESITPEKCEESLKLAKEFFSKYFPEYDYKCFTCESWLLDETLAEFLPENSNITSFRKMFEVVKTEESDAILSNIFRWNTSRRNIRNEIAATTLTKKVKEYVLKGKKFYIGYGIIEK